jgi:hypothetical protein
MREPNISGIELANRRTESSKTYCLDYNKFRLVASPDPIHYKDNYADKSEAWKDIDLTVKDGRLTTAPYELAVDGAKLTLRDKRTGSTAVLVSPDSGFTVEPFALGVRVKRVVKSAADKADASFALDLKGGGISVSSLAKGADGNPVPVQSALKDGILSESISPADLAKAKYPIEVDPTLTVQPSAQDASIGLSSPNTPASDGLYLTLWDLGGGGWTFIWRQLLQFSLAGLPGGATITAANLWLYYYSYDYTNPSGKTAWAYKLTRTNWVAAQATWNIYKTGSNWTTAGGDYVTSSPAGGSIAFPGSYDWMDWLVTAIVQDAYGAGNPAEFLVKFANEGLSGGYSRAYIYGTGSSDPTKYPKLVVDYTGGIVAPTVTTQDATDVSYTSCTGNGNITDAGGENCTRRGFCYKAGTSGDPTTADSVAYDDGSFAAGAYTKAISGLSPGTGYRVRAYAVNSAGTGYGATVQVTTLSVAPPTVTTQAATDIGYTTATGNGNITGVNGANADKRGFVYGESSHGDPGNVAPGSSGYDAYVEDTGSFGTGTFAKTMTGLTAGHHYYVRAYAHNSAGYAYGSEVDFYAIAYIPTVTTQDASSVGQGSAVGNGSITNNGGQDADQYGFDWGAQSGVYPYSVTETQTTGVGDFSDEMAGLSPSTQYFYRAKAHNSAGWGYGGEKTFTTIAATPVVRTDPPTDVTFTPAVITAAGYITNVGGANADKRGFVYGRTSIFANPGNAAPASAGYESYKEETGSFGVGSFATNLDNNLYGGKIYYLRAYAHNAYGYSYGSEIRCLVSDTVNLLYPTSDASKGIRFDSSPGGGYPHPYGGSIPHYQLVASKDSQYYAGGYWGWVAGNYVYERNYYNDNFFADLFGLFNPIIRTGTPIKVKWKARLFRNGYPYGEFKRKLYTHSTQYDGSALGISPTTYGMDVCEIFYVNPFTGVAWTVAELDAIQAGVSLGQEAGYGIACCDWLEVVAVWRNAKADTDPSTMYTGTNARLNGHVTEDEGEACTVWFQYGPTTGYGSATDAQTKARGENFWADISGLDPAILYHCRAVILTACGETFYGSDMTIDYDYGALILEQAYSVAGVRQPVFTVAPTWTAITQYLMKLHTKRGRMHELDHVEAGTAVFTLNNATGNFWRYNTAGAFYPDIKPLTLTRLRYRYQGIYYPVWYGVSEAYKPGWVVDEEAGMTPIIELECVDMFKSFNRYVLKAANPAVTTGALGSYSIVVDSVENLHVGQTLRIYKGSDEQVNQIISIDAPSLTVGVMDILVHNYSGGHAKKFPSVKSGTRIMDCLLEIGWPLALSRLDYGQCYIIEHTPDAKSGTNIMEHMYDVAESENGLIFMAADGYFMFQDSLARTKAAPVPPYPATNAFTVAQATFRDDGSDSKYVHPELADDDTFIYNEADIAGDGITKQVVSDDALQLEQGPRAIVRSSSQLFDSDDAFNQAFILVEEYKGSLLRCDTLLVKPQAAALNLYPVVLGSEISTRLKFLLNSATNPAIISKDYHVEGVEHDWNQRDNLWTTKFQLWNVAKVYACKSTHDGNISKWSLVDYITAHDAPQGDAIWLKNDAVDDLKVGQHPYIAFYEGYGIDRAVIEFNLTPIDPSWTIGKAFLAVRLSGSSGLFYKTAFKLEIVKATLVPSMPITIDTYGDLLPMLWNDDLGFVDIPGGGVIGATFEPYVAFIELNADGIAYLQSRAGGLCRVGLRSDHDMDAVAPTTPPGGAGNDEYVFLDSFAGGGFKPRLFIELA